LRPPTVSFLHTSQAQFIGFRIAITKTLKPHSQLGKEGSAEDQEFSDMLEKI
jgi:hypothetical protein